MSAKRTSCTAFTAPRLSNSTSSPRGSKRRARKRSRIRSQAIASDEEDERIQVESLVRAEWSQVLQPTTGSFRDPGNSKASCTSPYRLTQTSSRGSLPPKCRVKPPKKPSNSPLHVATKHTTMLSNLTPKDLEQSPYGLRPNKRSIAVEVQRPKQTTKNFVDNSNRTIPTSKVNAPSTPTPVAKERVETCTKVPPKSSSNVEKRQSYLKAMQTVANVCHLGRRIKAHPVVETISSKYSVGVKIPGQTLPRRTPNGVGNSEVVPTANNDLRKREKLPAEKTAKAPSHVSTFNKVAVATGERSIPDTQAGSIPRTRHAKQKTVKNSNKLDLNPSFTKKSRSRKGYDIEAARARMAKARMARAEICRKRKAAKVQETESESSTGCFIQVPSVTAMRAQPLQTPLADSAADDEGTVGEKDGGLTTEPIDDGTLVPDEIQEQEQEPEEVQDVSAEVAASANVGMSYSEIIATAQTVVSIGRAEPEIAQVEEAVAPSIPSLPADTVPPTAEMDAISNQDRIASMTAVDPKQSNPAEASTLINMPLPAAEPAVDDIEIAPMESDPPSEARSETLSATATGEPNIPAPFPVRNQSDGVKMAENRREQGAQDVREDGAGFAVATSPLDIEIREQYTFLSLSDVVFQEPVSRERERVVMNNGDGARNDEGGIVREKWRRSGRKGECVSSCNDDASEDEVGCEGRLRRRKRVNYDTRQYFAEAFNHNRSRQRKPEVLVEEEEEDEEEEDISRSIKCGKHRKHRMKSIYIDDEAEETDAEGSSSEDDIPLSRLVSASAIRQTSCSPSDRGRDSRTPSGAASPSKRGRDSGAVSTAAVSDPKGKSRESESTLVEVFSVDVGSSREVSPVETMPHTTLMPRLNDEVENRAIELPPSKQTTLPPLPGLSPVSRCSQDQARVHTPVPSAPLSPPDSVSKPTEPTTLSQKVLLDLQAMQSAFDQSAAAFVVGQKAYDRVAHTLASLGFDSPGQGTRVDAYAQFLAQHTRWANLSAAAIERGILHGAERIDVIKFCEVAPPRKKPPQK